MGPPSRGYFSFGHVIPNVRQRGTNPKTHSKLAKNASLEWGTLASYFSFGHVIPNVRQRGTQSPKTHSKLAKNASLEWGTVESYFRLGHVIAKVRQRGQSPKTHSKTRKEREFRMGHPRVLGALENWVALSSYCLWDSSLASFTFAASSFCWTLAKASESCSAGIVLFHSWTARSQ